jgi:hypothetical protein
MVQDVLIVMQQSCYHVTLFLQYDAITITRQTMSKVAMIVKRKATNRQTTKIEKNMPLAVFLTVDDQCIRVYFFHLNIPNFLRIQLYFVTWMWQNVLIVMRRSCYHVTLFLQCDAITITRQTMSKVAMIVNWTATDKTDNPNGKEYVLGCH